MLAQLPMAALLAALTPEMWRGLFDAALVPVPALQAEVTCCAGTETVLNTGIGAPCRPITDKLADDLGDAAYQELSCCCRQTICQTIRLLMAADCVAVSSQCSRAWQAFGLDTA